MFDKVCNKLCLYTRASRIGFFSSLLFILSVTVLGSLYWLEPQAVVPHPALKAYGAQDLRNAIVAEFGEDTGEGFFQFIRAKVEEGNALLQDYHFLRRTTTERATLTTQQARNRAREIREQWDEAKAPLLSAQHPFVQAVAEDVDEALTLATDGFAGGTPFLNRRLVRARGIFHDLHSVILAEEKENSYYGETRLGRIIVRERTQ